jgi:hypothetical protein
MKVKMMRDITAIQLKRREAKDPLCTSEDQLQLNQNPPARITLLNK